MTSAPRVVLAVLTYRRQRQLAALLPELVRQAARCGRPAGVLVVDNDPDGGAADVVRSLDQPNVTYVHEPAPGIAAARNRALRAAGSAEVLVFIDDDEWPCEHWLDLLLAGYGRDDRGDRRGRPTGVSGPVVTTYETPPARWMLAGRFFDRPRPPTGTILVAAATNNLLLDLAQVRALGVEFDEAYSLSGGSDTLFTRQLVARGGRLVWCDEAEVVDTLPASRSSLGWVLRRGMRIGITWSRTSLDLAGSGPARGWERTGATLGGLGRVVSGVGQLAAGLVTGSPYRQARGLKAVARGVGLLLGAYGVRYPEYRRVPSRAGTA